MFVIVLTYTKPLPEVDALMRKHMAWLNEQYAAGRFVVSGRQIPRTGGVILARGPRAAVEAYLESDPFKTHGIADFAVTEIDVTTAVAGVEALKG